MSKLFLYFGNDEYRVVEKARAFIESRVPENQRDAGLQIIDADGSTIEEALTSIKHAAASLKQIDLFGDAKIVWLRGCTSLGTGNPGKSEQVKSEWKTLIELFDAQLEGENVLLITANSVDKRGAFFKYCKTAATLEEFAMPEKDYQLRPFAVETSTRLFKESGIQAAANVIEYFVDRVGYDTRQLAVEVEKLSVYAAKEKKITAQDVSLISSANKESISWDLQDALGRNLSSALTVYRQLVYQRESVIGIMNQLMSRLKDLLIVKECMKRGWLRVERNGRYTNTHWDSDTEADNLLGVLGKADPRKMHSFRLSKLAEQAQAFSLKSLEQARAEAYAQYEKLFYMNVSQELLVELFIIKLFQIQSEEGRA